MSEYDTRCYFNVRSKAVMSSLFYRTEPTTKSVKTEKLKSKRGNMVRSNSKHNAVWGIHVVNPEEEKERLRCERMCKKGGFKDGV